MPVSLLNKFLIASSFVLKKRLASSLYSPGWHWNFLKLPDRPMVGHGSDAPAGQGRHGANHGNPNKRQDVIIETVQARSIL